VPFGRYLDRQRGASEAGTFTLSFRLEMYERDNGNEQETASIALVAHFHLDASSCFSVPPMKASIPPKASKGTGEPEGRVLPAWPKGGQ